MRRRLVVGAIALFAWSVAIEARLVFLQVIRHDRYVTRAKEQQNLTLVTPGDRGELLDRNGRALAYSNPASGGPVMPTIDCSIHGVVATVGGLKVVGL